MAAGGALASGAAKLAVMGAAHSLAYLVGSVVLGVGLARRTAEPLLRRSGAPEALATADARGWAPR
jgi:hypothetical protein